MHTEDFVTPWEKCVETRVVHPQPLITTPTPRQRPGIALFYQKWRDYTIIVYYYSRFPDVLSLESMSATVVITPAKSCFACFGIALSDFGLQFASQEFADLAKEYGFQQETTSSRFPQSNGVVGRIVRTVKEVKRFLPSTPFLPNYSWRHRRFTRSTPSGKTTDSPPILLETLISEIPPHQSFRGRDEVNKEVMTRNLNCRHNSRLLADPQPEEDAWVKQTF